VLATTCQQITCRIYRGTSLHIHILCSPILNFYSTNFTLPLLCFLPSHTLSPPQQIVRH
jgi:hypothetical protein